MSIACAPETRWVVLSNGHGEDAVGARVARSVARLAPTVHVRACPTVGEGHAYRETGATLVGPLRTMPSGGRTAEAIAAAVQDVAAGFVGMTMEQLRDLQAIRCDQLLVVGDVWAASLGLLPRAASKAWLQTLVSARMDDGSFVWGRRAFRERFTAPERLLMRLGYDTVFTRDRESAVALNDRGVRHARFVGNPMMDELAVPPLTFTSSGPRVALLPGTRHFAPEALLWMLEVIEGVPGVTAVVPWAGPTFPPLPAAWQAVERAEAGSTWRRGDATLHRTDAFAATLAWADVALGTAGTAHEQAAGMGVPVIAVPFGHTYPAAYLRNQRRLLGPAVEVVERDVLDMRTALVRLLSDPRERDRRAAEGRARMGGPGGSDAIVRRLLGTADLSQVAA